MTELDQMVRVALRGRSPGLVLIVVGPEGIRARSAVGMASLAESREMTTSAEFPWFSMTKVATATAIIRLIEAGAIELDGPVFPLVPALESLQPVNWARKITIRHLLQHSAGLPNPIPIKWIHRAEQEGPKPEILLNRILARNDKLRFEPGSKSSYSNIGALILGSVITRATGLPFEDAVHGQVIRPIGMPSTRFSYGSSGTAATGYHDRLNPMHLLLPRWVLGAATGRWVSLNPFLVDGAAYGGLLGNAEDAARLLRMHLSDGMIDGVRVISAEMTAEMRRIAIHGRRFDSGLGWLAPARRRASDVPFVEHLGSGAGFFNLMRMYPSQRVGALVMGNSTKYDIDAIADLALNFR
ncbi:serine hydrolase domain-containing protein [Streptomyces sp. NPDC020490]|uniref:serine hydrolase domain-containing protein n=1 Tax=Streptomyces sp. NPDC020490 TaxID=3365078 RepID=UPI0037AEB9BF